MIKKSLFLSTCLLMVGGLSVKAADVKGAAGMKAVAVGTSVSDVRPFALRPAEDPDQSPVFKIALAEELLNPSRLAAETPVGEPTTDSVRWALPDSVYANKNSGQYALFVYEYDARGNATRTELFQKMSVSWVSSQRIDAHYNRFDAVDTTINYYYNGNGYEPQGRKISVYDTLGRSIRMTNYTWLNSMSAWSTSSRYTYTYTPEGRLKTSLKEEVDMTIGELRNKEKIEYTYDAEGRQLSFEMTTWGGREWKPFRAYYCTYSKGRLINELGYILNEITGRYDSTYILDYIVNAQDQVTDYKQHFYNDSTASWQNTLHRTYTYNDKNQVTLEYTKVFDAALGEMENSTREYFFYNEAGQRDSVAYQTWRSIEWSHDISYKYSFNQWGGYSGWIYDNFTDDPRRDKYVFEHDADGNGIRSRAYTLNKKEWLPAERYDLEIYRKDGELILRSNALKVCEITAHYARGAKTLGPLPAEYYTVTLAANDPAFGEVSGEGTFIEGAEITVKATPKEGYLFKEWQENGVTVKNAKAEYTFMLTSNRALTAVFEKEKPAGNLNLETASLVTIYPNPATEVLNIVLNGREACTIELLTLSGVVVEKFCLQAGTTQKILNVSPYKGIYLLRVRQGRAEMSQKIVIL